MVTCPHCGGDVKAFDANRLYIDEDDIRRESIEADEAVRQIEKMMNEGPVRSLIRRIWRNVGG